jgi:methyl-accepting chemotaxis protein
MKLTVIRKIVFGFVALGMLLLLTSFLSYVGLLGISKAAKSVVQQKMPVQAAVIKIQADALKLANITTNGYYERDDAALESNKQQFEQSVERFNQEFAKLNGLLTQSQLADLQPMQTFLAASEQMYVARAEHIALSAQAEVLGESVIGYADEASALMIDLSYLSGSSAELQTLIGAGASIDNKLAPMLSTTKELVSSDDAELSQRIMEDLEYSISNIQVDKDYVNRLAETVDDEGLVEMFNEQFESLKQELESDQGLFAVQTAKLAAITTTEQKYSQAKKALDQGLQSIEALFNQINQQTLQGF